MDEVRIISDFSLILSNLRYEQTTLSGSAKDQAMASTVEETSASRVSGGSGEMQRTEARCQGRNHVPMNLDKAHVTSDDSSLLKAGDSCREKGGTQKSLTGSFTHKM